MSRTSRLAVATAIGGLLVARRRTIGPVLRWADQRAGLFAPRGAGLYNALAPGLLGPFYRRVAEDVASSQPATGRMLSVLDVGSGPGELSFEIARRLPGAAVVGVDLAEPMVARASRAAATSGLAPAVRFELADAAALPVPDASVDVVVSTLSLHHWADPAAVFAELWRVLRPGAPALVYDLRALAYDRRDLELFLAHGRFAGTSIDRAPMPLPLGLLFVRIRLVRPTGP